MTMGKWAPTNEERYEKPHLQAQRRRDKLLTDFHVINPHQCSMFDLVQANVWGADHQLAWAAWWHSGGTKTRNAELLERANDG